MFKLLFGLLLVILLIILLAGSIGISLLRALFGIGTKQQQPPREKTRTYSEPKNREKVFDKNEGEYVEYEEIKEDEQKTSAE